MSIHVNLKFPVLKVLFASLAVGLLSGCSGSFAPSAVKPDETPVGNIQGSVHGGQAPVTGAQIYLFAASTAGYGHISTSLITSGKTGVTCNNSGTLTGDCYVTTDSNGNFALSGDYTCTQGTQVYMVAVGGNPGLTGGEAPISATVSFARHVTTITVADTTGITPGMAVTSSGIAANTTVAGVSGTTVTLSQQTSSNKTNVTMTFSTTIATFSSGSSTIDVLSAAGITTGMAATGSGVGGIVTGVSGTTITLSQQTSSAGTNVPVMFSAPGSVNNTAIVQMAGLGQCPAAGNLAAQVPYLVINEVTTVAFAYSMSGFGSDAFHISADATGATALAHAMANTNNIVNIQYGQAPTVANGNPNSIAPQAKLYTLASIVAQCVNSSDAGTSNCTNLFNLATNSAGTAPTDESTALFNIAQNQARNASAIYNLLQGTAVFTPTLKSVTDWTMPVIYKGLVSTPGTSGVPPAYTSGPFNIAFDASGNAWIGDRAKGVVEVGPQGAATTINGFGMVKGVAVSPIDGTIWVSDYGNNEVDVMNSAGTILTRITTDLSGPIFTAFGGNVSGRSFAYEANETTTGIVAFDPQAYTVQDFESANFPDVKTPGWISVDNNGNIWIPSTSTNFVGQMTTSEKGKSGNFTYASSEIGEPSGTSSYSLGADANGNLWFGSNTGNGDLEEILSGQTAATDIGNGGGVNGAYKIAVDGNNTIWIANANANTVSAYNGGWVAANGFSTSAPGGPGCVVAAPDPSGNLWTANADGSVTQLLGLATPTAAPFYGGISSNSKAFAGNLATMP